MERTHERHGEEYDERPFAQRGVQHGEGRDAELSSQHDELHGSPATSGHGPIDLAPSADRIMRLVPGVDDAQLDDPTPCEGYPVSRLLAHMVGFTAAFRAAADKAFGPLTDTSPDEGGWPHLQDDWREVLPERLPALVTAWYARAAWEGMTRAGGVDLPGEVAGVVALSELTLHGWDLARATGQDYHCDDATAAVLATFVEGFDPKGTPGLFGPALEPGPDADTFDRVLARAGRDRGWTPRQAS